jgi:CRP-like cAMP-binding protein
MKLSPQAKSIPNRSPEIQQARNHLRRFGWTHQAAAAALGVSRVHLTYVLNERRQSRRILRAIAELPDSQIPA